MWLAILPVATTLACQSSCIYDVFTMACQSSCIYDYIIDDVCMMNVAGCGCEWAPGQLGRGAGSHG